MEPAETANVIVAGTGPAGLIAALAMAQAGFSVQLVGPAVIGKDRRTTALMVPALEYMESIGVLSAIEPNGAPLRTMRIVDATRRLIRSPVVTFHASEISEPYFGLNIPNLYLNEALEQAVKAQPGIVWHEAMVERWDPSADRVRAILPDGTALTAALAVAADGRLSPAREAAGISTSTHPYPQAALVLNFAHTREHGFASTEFHTETGPFTQVPLPGNRSSLVWVVRPETADELVALDDETLSMRVEERMQSMLGRVTVEAGRQVYPLSARLPARFAQNRIALVGEAAHVFPPIGAQGLNLGIRDVQQLVEIAASHRSDPGSSSALSTYDRRRRPDIFARTGAVGLLNQSLLSNLLPAQMLRSAGLSILGGFAPLRALFMREGLKPGSGLAALGSSLRDSFPPRVSTH
ncbi:UbiH/UbiF family hydroxylase [Pseudaminobacter soli (ex Li et al. 2025)]|uniref:2-octaprenyl-6-methoxyphenyl hydroxylase n=1 Tax=Pseudaminobacter soli (ex Li et al. 2025) TaxID=1295366 RepID=A0A2P7SNU4_9HYPH|nr:UbiH/UbiF family hydroxylase [Mesorhizobium soli]PSJ64159.1 2-octaprenyl-6-methoxyphenyl hydroxylase [Mesorhizobium soli]